MITLIQHAQETGVQVPLGYVAAVVGALVTAVVVLFGMLIKAYDKNRRDAQEFNKALMDEKQKRLEDAIEYERSIGTLKDRLSSRRGGGDVSGA